MVPRRVLRPLVVALLSLVALAPCAGRPLPASAASLTFTVTSTADTHDASPGDGACADAANQCTVRAAVEEATAQPAGSAITVTIPAGTYALSLGTLVLTQNRLTLVGAGMRSTLLTGGGHRLLLVARTAYATIGGLTLMGSTRARVRAGPCSTWGPWSSTEAPS